ncbi:effector-associated domain EAD1-containing protein [Paractinoplanes globisporus]|uniref:Effector-associated domain EAD1-containing protein n=1 Tax=Paractinoplanes globisporus TaxID=113565 RepID=A0ABW6WCG6_9ACTN|nr:effector-associated domain EAD1-containing protein [Actinoplanes globisporus]
MRGSGGPSGPDDGDAEIPLNEIEREDLLHAVAEAFNSEAAAENILDRIQFPRSQRPNFTTLTPDQYWTSIGQQLRLGVIFSPNRRLIEAALRVYAHNEIFRGLALRYGLIQGEGRAAAPVISPPTATTSSSEPATETPQPETPQPETPSEAPAPPPVVEEETATCHVIVRASSEDERAEAAKVLQQLGLEPQDVWATTHAVSFQVNLRDTSALRRLLDQTDIGWTVVPPTARDYLLRQLYVDGPDGRRFRLLDAPAQQTVANVAQGVVDQYGGGFTDRARPTVVDHVEQGGKGRRLDPEQTLHDAGVGEGSLLRVGFQATAGAVNPLDRQDALSRARNEILEAAAGRPDLVVSAAPPTLPTEYEIEFEQESFGPPDADGGDPRPVFEHVVQIRLRPDFPEVAPVAYWLTPIFHPNVYPNYDSEQARDRPYQRGLVCLGELAEAYVPGLHFGKLVETLIAMAAFRNYAVFEPTGEVGPDGRTELRGNFYDSLAARWVLTNQDRIVRMGGRPIRAEKQPRAEYRNMIEELG